MTKSFSVTLITYTTAFFVAFFACKYSIGLNQWLMILIGHLSATVVVFVFSRIYRNSSLYDPFWSVAPIPIAIYLSLYPETGEINTTKVLLITAPILFWGIRLTLNWARDWKGLIDEDFRYINLKEKPFAILIDLFGIHIYPTLQVNLSLLPIYFSLSLSNADVNIWLVIASLFTCLSVVLETVADEQMRKFRRNKENLGKTMRKGLWSLSRHPNYLGEILFWWGLYFMTISLDLNYWYLFICPLIMNLMFSLITCQMMDNRSIERRKDYVEYMNSTRQLLIFPK